MHRLRRHQARFGDEAVGGQLLIAIEVGARELGLGSGLQEAALRLREGGALHAGERLTALDPFVDGDEHRFDQPRQRGADHVQLVVGDHHLGCEAVYLAGGLRQRR